MSWMRASRRVGKRHYGLEPLLNGLLGVKANDAVRDIGILGELANGDRILTGLSR